MPRPGVAFGVHILAKRKRAMSVRSGQRRQPRTAGVLEVRRGSEAASTARDGGQSALAAVRKWAPKAQGYVEEFAGRVTPQIESLVVPNEKSPDPPKWTGAN